MTATGAQWADFGERTAWTLLQAGLGTELVALTGLPEVWTIPIIGALAAVKAALATRWGNGTSATLPASLERF